MGSTYVRHPPAAVPNRRAPIRCGRRRHLRHRGALVICIVGFVPAVAAAQATPITVGVYDNVGVPHLPEVLVQVAGWFAPAGIVLDWVDFSRCETNGAPEAGCPSGRPGLALKILDGEMAGVMTPRRDVHGMAPGDDRRERHIAYVFYDRVGAVPGGSAALWMAVVTAHELGHLLLPHGSHARGGLMRPVWSLAEIATLEAHTLGFSPLETLRMRRRVRRSEVFRLAARSVAGESRPETVDGD